MKQYFKLGCGQQFDTKPEIKAFIRGLELMRDELNLSEPDAAKVAAWLDDANSQKNTGHLTDAEHEKRKAKADDAAAAHAAKVAEKPKKKLPAKPVSDNAET